MYHSLLFAWKINFFLHAYFTFYYDWLAIIKNFPPVFYNEACFEECSYEQFREIRKYIEGEKTPIKVLFIFTKNFQIKFLSFEVFKFNNLKSKIQVHIYYKTHSSFVLLSYMLGLTDGNTWECSRNTINFQFK